MVATLVYKTYVACVSTYIYKKIDSSSLRSKQRLFLRLKTLCLSVTFALCFVLLTCTSPSRLCIRDDECECRATPHVPPKTSTVSPPSPVFPASSVFTFPRRRPPSSKPHLQKPRPTAGGAPCLLLLLLLLRNNNNNARVSLSLSLFFFLSLVSLSLVVLYARVSLRFHYSI